MPKKLNCFPVLFIDYVRNENEPITTLLSRIVARVRLQKLAASAPVSMRTRNGIKKSFVWKVCFALIMAMVAPQAFSACRFAFTSQLLMVSPGTVVIPSDLPVGSELPITTQWNGRGQFTCDYPYPPTGLYTYGNSLTIPLTKAPGFSDVWATGYPGIGVRMYSYITGQPITANPTTTPTLGGPMGGGSPGLYFMYSIISAASNAVRLIKTGDIPSGTFPSTLFATDFAQSAQAPAFGYLWQNSNTRLSTWTLGSFTIASSTPTCSLSTASATFDMGTLPATSFTGGAGVAYPVWAQDQSLISGGCNASTVSMTFAGIAAAAPYSNAFANQGTAKGVALELWQKNGLQAIPNSSTPINFAPQGTGGKYTFSARYLQTAPTVTAGTVNATVTVTVNYK